MSANSACRVSTMGSAVNFLVLGSNRVSPVRPVARSVKRKVPPSPRSIWAWKPATRVVTRLAASRVATSIEPTSAPEASKSRARWSRPVGAVTVVTRATPSLAQASVSWVASSGIGDCARSLILRSTATLGASWLASHPDASMRLIDSIGIIEDLIVPFPGFGFGARYSGPRVESNLNGIKKWRCRFPTGISGRVLLGRLRGCRDKASVPIERP